jgi:hypothetical protein
LKNISMFVASKGELSQAPQLPSPEGEGVQGMRQFKGTEIY